MAISEGVAEDCLRRWGGGGVIVWWLWMDLTIQRGEGVWIRREDIALRD